jgi:hypothetical protein
MKTIAIIFIFGLFTKYSFGAEKMMKDLQWFKRFDCEKLQIVKYHSASSKIIEKQITITDADYIKSFQSQINRLPTKGDEMIKMGPNACYLTLEFSCNGDKEIVKFYNSKINTPDTSFYSTTDGPDRIIWEEIQMHLGNPELDSLMPKVKNVTYFYDDFTIEFLGSEDRTSKEKTASLYTDSFKVISKKDKSEQTVEVPSGQLPPRPQKFKVGDDSLVISTYVGKDGTRLNPRVFVIFRD